MLIFQHFRLFEKHYIITNVIRNKAPVIFFCAVSIVVICYYAAITKQCIDSCIMRRCQFGEQCDIRVGCAVLPL